jgi:hypothetical protein
MAVGLRLTRINGAAIVIGSAALRIDRLARHRLRVYVGVRSIVRTLCGLPGTTVENGLVRWMSGDR